MYIILTILLILISLFLIIILKIQYKLFDSPNNKLRILEYHSISKDGFEDQITISKEKFIKQLNYLKKHNFNTIWISDLDNYLKNNQKIPKKTVILTFDDGFLDNYKELYPLLKEYNFKAVGFLVFNRIGKNINWSGEFANSDLMLMNLEQIKETQSHIEYGFHTFNHDNYEHLNFQQIKNDLEKCKEFIKQNNLTIYPALAYTYGGYYRKKNDNQKQFFSILEEFNLKYALRIGNRINSLPIKNKYEIYRIDIRGYENICCSPKIKQIFKI